MRRLAFTPKGWKDYTDWASLDRVMLERINRLIDDVLRDPFVGLGKPEPLKHAFAAAWSRRITDEHRLVHLIEDEEIVILQARYHYS